MSQPKDEIIKKCQITNEIKELINSDLFLEEQDKNNNKENKIKNNIEIYEEMEQDNINEKLIIKKKNKRKFIKLIKNKLLKYIIMNIIIISIIYFLYFFFNNKNIIKNRNYEKTSKIKNKLNFNMTLKLNYTITYKYTYSSYNRKNLKFPIHSVSQFPSGNIISIDSISINIFDIFYNLIQKIYIFEASNEIKDQKKLFDAAIKDENTFAISSNNGIIKIFSKVGKKFKLKQNIESSNRQIKKLIFDSKGKLYSGCYDGTIKIWEQNEDGQYINTRILNHTNLFIFLLLEDKNILISKSTPTINFYNTSNDYKLIKAINESSIYELERFEDDKIIIYYNKTLKIISISKFKVIKKVEIDMKAFIIRYYKEKGIILVGGSFQYYKDWDLSLIKIYRSDNLELINTIYNTNGMCTYGIKILQNGLIATYGYPDQDKDDYVIKLYSLEQI